MALQITDSYRSRSLQHNVENSLDALTQLQNRLSTGKRIQTLSDDPSGASLSLSLRGALVDNAQYQRDADQARAFLTAGENALGGATDLVRQARQIALQGANSTQTPAGFAALAQQVDGLISQVTRVANSAVHGKFLFSGTQTRTEPFLANDPAHVYQGNAGTVAATVGPGDSVTLNTPGSQVFAPIFSALETLKTDLAAGNVAAVSAGITTLDGALDSVSTQRASVGAQINTVDAVKQRLGRAQGEYQAALSDAEDVDLAQTYVQLQSAQNVYQASLATTARAYQHSLADYL